MESNCLICCSFLTRRSSATFLSVSMFGPPCSPVESNADVTILVDTHTKLLGLDSSAKRTSYAKVPSLAIFAAMLSRLLLIDRTRGRGQAVEFRSSIEPDLG